MVASTDLLYYQGFKVPDLGDLIPVWRGETCFGHIALSGLGEFSWRFSVGGTADVRRQHGLSTYEQAQEGICTALTEWAKETGLTVYGPAIRPASLKDGWGDEILSTVKMFTESSKALSYMGLTLTKRMLNDMSKDERGRVGREVRSHIHALQQRELEAADDNAA